MNKNMLACVLSLASLWGGSEINAQKFEQIARTPPMGWNSWNKFNCDINEHIVREIADAMASNGMKEAGYEYVVIDDCWQGERDSLGFIQPNPNTFPSGMKALADYIHSKGLKFGLYSSIGEKTCQGRSGSGGREYQDAIQFSNMTDALRTTATRKELSKRSAKP